MHGLYYTCLFRLITGFPHPLVLSVGPTLYHPIVVDIICVLINKSYLKTRGKAKATRGQAMGILAFNYRIWETDQMDLCEFKATQDPSEINPGDGGSHL